MLTSSIFSSNVLKVSSYWMGPFDRSYTVEPQKGKPLSDSALPEDWLTAVPDSTLLPYTSHTWKETEAIVLLNNPAQY